MGHIKEPKGIDFVISSDALTVAARKEISEFINNYKITAGSKKVKSNNPVKRSKLAHA